MKTGYAKIEGMNIRNDTGLIKDDGMTLIEVIVVVSIVGILAMALGFSFQGWMGSYNVESEIKNIYTDIMNARTQAMQKNRAFFIDFPDTTSYALYEDTGDGTSALIDGDGSLQAGTGAPDDTRLQTFPKIIRYPIEVGTENGVPPITFIADTKGILSPDRSICMFTDIDGDKTSDYNPDYDCIVIFATRINLGKIIKQDTDGGTCVASNCQIK
ncbi:MAG: prepilin-type N-terminal cleavage/methylation domain-containing protein [Nitrospirae bacterium]|nr:prepilin-type N-terminal cleavage/methylation domain-containing protein [Nitrospirota bacterium]